MTRIAASLGLYGLGTMGSALALNILERDFPLHVSNRSPEKVPAFMREAGPLAARLTGHDGLADMARAMAGTLDAPRAIILMVPAGAAVDAAVAELLPHLAPGDIVVDAGNADFRNTMRRTADLASRGQRFVGMGVSGGEDGARHGPSIMVGGAAEAWDILRPMIEEIAAWFDGSPCAAHVGPDGAGHFVKTVHNGIEYADMQLIAEVYGLLRTGMGHDPDDIAAIFARWNHGPLQSYLVEITAKVLAATDHATGLPAVDVIADRAGQKGTGRWTVIEALHLGQSATVIEAAVAARGWSAEAKVRRAGEAALGGIRRTVALNEADLAHALQVARILAHAQGFRVLAAASDEFDWGLDLARIAEIWRAGCIIRSALLDDLAAAFRTDLPQGQLFLAPAIAERLRDLMPGLRRVVGAAVMASHPVPALSAALAFADTMAQARGTTALIQAQRDFFGRHGFERVDGGTDKHGPWWD